MKFQQLKYFVAAAQEGSLSKAARVVHVAQPALSQQIIKLEQSLSVQLLERKPSGVRPTPAGEILLQHARSILEQIDTARHDVLMEGTEVRGEVSLILPIALSELVTPRLLQITATMFPDVRLHIREGSSLHCQALLENARVDVGVLPGVDGIAKIESINALTQNLYLVGAKGMTLDDDDNHEITFKDAMSCPLALPAKPHSLRLEIERLAEKYAFPLNIIADSDSSRIVRSYATGGIACSILPWSSFYERFSLGQHFARRIIDPEIKRTYRVAWPRGRPLNRPGAVIRDLTLEIISDLAKTFP